MKEFDNHSTLRILAEVSFFLFVVLFAVSLPSLSVPGRRWPNYALAAVFAILPLAVGKGWLRWAVCAALLVSGLMVFGDVQGGQHVREEMRQKVIEYERTHENKSR